MISSNMLYDALQLAEASYALLDRVPPGDSAELIAALKDKEREGLFSATQADALAASWRFVHQQPNTETGFSATVFRKNGSSSDYVLAIRGTEFLVSLQEFGRDLVQTDFGEIFHQKRLMTRHKRHCAPRRQG